VGKIIISTKNSPAAIGPYSQAINVKGDITFTSGQIPLDPNTGKLVSENFGEQVIQTLDNIRGILKERNCGLSNLIKLTVYLTDLSNFDELNTIFEDYWGEWFDEKKIHYPSRSAVEVSKLPKNAQVEIEAIFYDYDKN
jgi:2-iminobutanoate/2-iminopropanoate deaminase